jgi:2-phospho-L-lactate/phosphoenolpyruvate guanylyltransferase
VEPLFHIVIPFKHENAKSRLSSVLSPMERRLLAFAMLKDVLSAVLRHSWAAILARPGLDIVEVGYDVEIVESELELNDALNSLIAEEACRGWRQDILIVMADLALLTEKDVVGILNCEGDLVLCPGRGGGTNMILIRSPAFRACYQGLSFPRHLAFAREAGLSVTVFESFRAGCDIDEPEDLSEVLLHGRGETKALLEKLNFKLSEDRRCSCTREMISSH